MKTQEDCLNALASGKKLTNGSCVVHLDAYGYQVHTGRVGKNHSNGSPYTFDSPKYWSIYEEPKVETSSILKAISKYLGFSK